MREGKTPAAVDGGRVGARRTVWLALGAAALLALSACAQADPALEPVAPESTPPAGLVTLPPPWTPTPTVVPTPTLTRLSSSTLTLSPSGPWVLYCDVNDEAALMDPAGPGRWPLRTACLNPAQVSGAVGLAVEGGRILQFPSGETVREARAGFSDWSADGRLALLAGEREQGAGTQLVVYDAYADRLRPIHRSELELTPLGLSTQGGWAVYLEAYRDSPQSEEGQTAPQVVAVSTDGQRRRELLDISDSDVFYDRALGWLSESSLLLTRSDYPCNLAPRNLDLQLVDLNTGEVRQLFGPHAYAALDPLTETVLLVELPPGPCRDGEGAGRLLRLTGRYGWRPHEVSLPAAWGSGLTVRWIEWHEEFGGFSVAVAGGEAAPLHLLTLSPDGRIEMEFSLPEVESIEGAALFPSPDGEWIIVGAAAPHGTRLYDRHGRLIKKLGREGGPLSNGVRHVLWLPGQDVVFMTEAEGTGIFAAAAADGWRVVPVEAEAGYRSTLTLVDAPSRPFRHACDWKDDGRQRACQQACNGRDITRLVIGDHVAVSYEPAQASRLRSVAGLEGQVIHYMAPGVQAQLVGGPICQDGHIWWRLEPEGLAMRGWAAEGDEQGAWLLPVESEP